MQKNYVDFIFRGVEYHVDFAGTDIFLQGFADIADHLRDFRGVNMLAGIGNGAMNVMYINARRPQEKNASPRSKERKTFLAEKKSTPTIQIPKHRELSLRIAELTEELEGLHSEKALILQSLQYSNVLKEYAELQEQAADFDPDELTSERLAIRPDKERFAVSRVQSAYGDRYQPLMMYDSKRDVSDMLDEETEARSIRERLRKKPQEKQKLPQQNKEKGYER